MGGAICSRNGIVEETGVAAGVLGDPVEGIVWLARRLHGLGIPCRQARPCWRVHSPGHLIAVLATSFTSILQPALDLGVITLSVE